MSDAVGIWIVIATGVVAIMGSLYGLYKEWQQRRINQTVRLNDAAMLAVRNAEASFVRPLLTNRLAETLKQFTTEHIDDPDHLHFRALLFVELHRGVQISKDEKAHAKLLATNVFISIMKCMPNPPIKIHTDADEIQHAGRISEVLELAYSLRTRPSVDLMQQVAVFCSGATFRETARGRCAVR